MINNSMEPREEVKECPFCRAEAYYEHDGDGEFAVDHKPGCYLTGHRKISLTDSWNTRPSKPVETNGLVPLTKANIYKVIAPLFCWSSVKPHLYASGINTLDEIIDIMHDRLGTPPAVKALDEKDYRRIELDMIAELIRMNASYEMGIELNHIHSIGHALAKFSTTNKSTVCENCGWSNDECRCVSTKG